MALYKFTPPSKPRLAEERVLDIIENFEPVGWRYGLYIVGVRGYYLDSMGARGANDRGIYDDALFVVSKNAYASFNGNTDPSYARKGFGTGANKGMAMLDTGIWYSYCFGYHKTYEAIVQRMGTVTVTRDGDPPYKDTGYFGINIHKGSYTKTSSEGCQTVHPDQWKSFITLAKSEAIRAYGKEEYRKKIIPYILIDETERRTWY